MGKWVHRLSNVDIEARQGTCANCGNVKLYLKENKPFCSVAVQARNAVRRSENPQGTPAWKRHGLSQVRYDQMLIDQDYSCKICGKHTDENGRALSVDHDHTCCPDSRSCGKCIRGLLCQTCNVGIGMFADRLDIMYNAISYLKDYENLG